MEGSLTEEPEEEDCRTDSEGKEEQEKNPEKTKEHSNSQQFQHHGLLRSHTLFPLPPRVPFHHLWKNFHLTVPVPKDTKEEEETEQNLKDPLIDSSDEENVFTADEEEEEEQERDQRYPPNTTVHMEQTHNDIHATPTSTTTGKENELEEQVHFLYMTQPRNKIP